MARRVAAAPLVIGQALLEIYTVNERINQILLEHLDPHAWRVKPPGGRGRTIAAIFAHMHNIRRKWLRLSAPHLKLPAPLDRSRCTQKQARAARDGWARPWPAGAAMFAYMVSHDVHHRGQVSMLAGQLGFSLPGPAAYGIWNWEKLWRECGFTHPR